jgi:hypothetical protein
MTAVVGLEGQSVKDMFADGELDFFRVEVCSSFRFLVEYVGLNWMVVT